MSPSRTSENHADAPSAGASVHAILRTRILEGDLPPGTVLYQVPLAQELGVSRTPLREALRRLQEEGLVEGEPQRKVRVSGFDPADLDAIYSARITLEVLALSVSVPRMTDTTFRSLEDDLQKMEATAGARDLSEWEIAHRAFHARLIGLSGATLVRTIEALAERTERYRRILFRLREPRGWTHAALEHQAIVEACKMGRPHLAAAELARHLSRTALALNAELAPEREPAMIRTALVLAQAAGEQEDPTLVDTLAKGPFAGAWSDDPYQEAPTRKGSKRKPRR